MFHYYLLKVVVVWSGSGSGVSVQFIITKIRSQKLRTVAGVLLDLDRRNDVIERRNSEENTK